MAERASAEVDKGLHFRIVVVNTINHSELVGWPTAGLFDVGLDGLVQTRKGVLLDSGHELVASALDSGVKRDGERELLGELGEALDARDDAGSRDGEVARADLETAGSVEHTERRNRFVEVGERLTLAHEDNTGHALAEVVGDVQHLVDHFLRGEGAGEPGDTRGTEGAAHGAAGLSGDADGKLVAIGHANRLNRDTVGEFEQVLAGTVLGAVSYTHLTLPTILRV